MREWQLVPVTMGKFHLARGGVEFFAGDWKLGAVDGDKVHVHSVHYPLEHQPAVAPWVKFSVTMIDVEGTPRYAIGLVEGQNRASGFDVEIRAGDGCAIRGIRVEWEATSLYDQRSSTAVAA